MKINISLSAVFFTKGQKVIVKIGKDEWYAGSIQRVGRASLNYTILFNDGDTVTLDANQVRNIKAISKTGKKTAYTDADAKALYSTKPKSATPVKSVKPKELSKGEVAFENWREEKLRKEKAMAKELAPYIKELKLPKGANSKITEFGYNWGKRSRNADRVLTPVYEMLLEPTCSFKKLSSKSTDHPTGSWTGHGDKYTNGKYVLSISVTHSDSTRVDISLAPIESLVNKPAV